MDPALLREHAAFKQRASLQPSVEKKRRVEPEKEVIQDDGPKKKPKVSSSVSSGSKLNTFNYKTVTGSSNLRFGILTKIVQHMKARHLEGDDHPLTLDEIIDETNQLDIKSKDKQWLFEEALPKNPKIESLSDGKFIFKPKYKIRDKKTLLKLLRQHDLRGEGGIMLDDIQESLPHGEKHLKNLGNEILYITRGQDKKKILYYNDKTADFIVDEETKKLWRSIAVDAVDDAKIEEHLEKQGIKSMQDQGPKKVLPPKRKKPNRRKTNRKPKDNEHLMDVLETYDENK